jgi:hypothetical protein
MPRDDRLKEMNNHMSRAFSTLADYLKCGLVSMLARRRPTSRPRRDINLAATANSTILVSGAYRR